MNKEVLILFFLNMFSGAGYSIIAPLFPILGKEDSISEDYDFNYKYSIKKKPFKKSNKKKLTSFSNKKIIKKREESYSSSEESEESEEYSDKKEYSKYLNKTTNNFHKKDTHSNKIIEDIYMPKRKINRNDKPTLFKNTSKFYQHKKGNSDLANNRYFTEREKFNINQHQKTSSNKKIDLIRKEDESESSSEEEKEEIIRDD